MSVPLAMSAPLVPELLLGLGAGVAGVLLLVLGLPLCGAIFGRRFVRAYRHRRLERVTTALAITAAVAVAGIGLWSLAIASAPGVYDEPLVMLAVTFLPFTVAFAALAVVVQHFTVLPARPVAASVRRASFH
ncbi:hypothetical protein [Herbiconiux sp. L3-i23]|uniref:hypothetical protein n=1 Tax=Herbiconiux sp. L3-i23 TaxID=2905871 RepID=UPI00205CAC53|nr:hypothetical protein [Herbiconiux sp. L3-i23]BDI22483.1 hypothetical protein L3i23_12590 [Herbiconiux sp. L3-i23]